MRDLTACLLFGVILIGTFLFSGRVSSFLSYLCLCRAASKILLTEFADRIVIESRSSHRRISLRRKIFCGYVYLIPDPLETVGDDEKESLPAEVETVDV